MLDAFSVLIGLSAVFVWINAKTWALSPSIATMLAGLLAAAAVYLLDQLGVADLLANVSEGIQAIDFGNTLMNVVLGVLLFVSALKLNTAQLERQQIIVLALALLSTLLNTFVTGYATWALLAVLGLEIPVLHCLLFGALISPTDPIATVAILKSIGLPEKLEVLIEGESLLNDGVGAVVFTVLAGIVVTGQTPTVSSLSLEFGRDVGGGLVLGFVLGWLGGKAARSAGGDPSIPFLMALGVIFFGGFAARHLHVSYPLAMVVAGIAFALTMKGVSRETRNTFITIWKMIENVLIAGLFLMIGLLALLPSEKMSWAAMGLIIPVVLLCRFFSVGAILGIASSWQGDVRLPGLLTWGGLRGGISIALALSVPADANKTLLLDLAYAVVLCSVLIQAPTIRLLFPAKSLKQLLRAY